MKARFGEGVDVVQLRLLLGWLFAKVYFLRIEVVELSALGQGHYFFVLREVLVLKVILKLYDLFRLTDSLLHLINLFFEVSALLLVIGLFLFGSHKKGIG